MNAPLQPVQRIVAIDLGTNSFHAIIVDIYPDGSFRTVDKLKEMVFLAKGGFEKGLSLQTTSTAGTATQIIHISPILPYLISSVILPFTAAVPFFFL